MTDPLIAALTAEPETIGEFETALERFVERDSDWSPLRGFRHHQNFEPYDAGILCIDLAGRVIGVESGYSSPSLAGDVKVPNKLQETGFSDDNGDVYVPYRLPDDWKIVRSISGFKGEAAAARKTRAADLPFDARGVLFGLPLIEFVVAEMIRAEDLDAEELFTEIHSKWLIQERDDLRGKSPREVLLEKQDFISFDLHSRALQYSFTKLCPRPIPADSFAYLNAGFGVHEAVMYYDLIRVLMDSLYDRIKKIGPRPFEDHVEFLAAARDHWLDSPNSASSGRTPAEIIETERKRLNLTITAQECLIDDDCPACVAMYEDFDTPGFWHYDGCNMDGRFEFSFYKTREEWDEEQRRYEQFNREFNEGKWQTEFGVDDLLDNGEEPF